MSLSPAKQSGNPSARVIRKALGAPRCQLNVARSLSISWRFISGGACFILASGGFYNYLIKFCKHIAAHAEWRADSHPVAAIFLYGLVEIGFLGCTYGAVRLAWLETLLLPTRFKPPKQIEEEEAHWAAANWDHAKPGK